MTTTSATDNHLISPAPIEGDWQTGPTDTITIGDYTASLTPEGAGAKRSYTIARRGKQIDHGTLARTPRRAVNRLLHQRHFASLPTQLLEDWRAALAAVLRARQEARWTDAHGATWRRWQAVLGSLEFRSPAGKILEDLTVTDVDGLSAGSRTRQERCLIARHDEESVGFWLGTALLTFAPHASLKYEASQLVLLLVAEWRDRTRSVSSRTAGRRRYGVRSPTSVVRWPTHRNEVT